MAQQWIQDRTVGFGPCGVPPYLTYHCFVPLSCSKQDPAAVVMATYQDDDDDDDDRTGPGVSS